MVLLAARDHDRRPEARELGCDRLAQAGAASGDEDRDPFERARLQRGLADGRRRREPLRFGHLGQFLSVAGFNCR
jgi:hypothetical protein